MDESGIDRHLHRRNARSVKGKKVFGFVAGKKFQRTNIVAGYVNGKTIAECVYDCTTDGEVFIAVSLERGVPSFMKRKNLPLSIVGQDAPVECDGYNAWVEQFLVASLKPWQVVVMDNAAFHKHPRTRNAIEAAGCSLIYLPPYSPDSNPIEKFWAIVVLLEKGMLLNDI